MKSRTAWRYGAALSLALCFSPVIADDDSSSDDGGSDDGSSRGSGVSIDIDSAIYSNWRGRLYVRGEIDDSDDDQVVELYDADQGSLLATNYTDEDFSFRVGDFGGNTPPCRIRVVAGGQSAEKDVRGAPSNCSQFSLVLTGIVRDSAIPFATVTVTVGGVTYTTVADENGEFVIEIATVDLDDLVTIESSGANPNDETQSVDMSSIAGSFSKLVEDSNGDGVVDGTENSNINNTPFTTAMFVLVAEANGGEIPATVEELDEAAAQVDGQEVLQTAAVIKAIVDGGVPIPVDPDTGEPYESIIEFISDTDTDGGGNTPIENFVADNTEAVEDAAEEIVSDPAIVPAFVEADIPSRYYSIPASVEGFLARNGAMLAFSPDSTGTFGGLDTGGSGNPVSNDYTWSIEDGQLKLNLTADPFTTGWTVYQDGIDNLDVCNDTAADMAADTGCKCADVQAAFDASPFGFLDGTFETRAIAYTRLAVSGATEFVRQYSNNVTTIVKSPGNSCSYFDVSTGEAELRNEELFESIPFDALALEGTAIAMPFYFDQGEHGYIDWIGDPVNDWGVVSVDIPRSVRIDLLDFEASSINCPAGWQDIGTLYSTQPAGESSFDACWRVMGPGESRTVDGQLVSKEGDLEIDYQDGWIQVARRLDQLGVQNGVFHDFWNTNTLERFGYYDVAIEADPGLVFTEALMINNPDEFWNGMINGWSPDQYDTDGDGNLVHTSPWGWQFRAGGVLYNGTPGNQYAGQVDGWEILGADLALDGSFTIPAGAMRMNRSCWYSRFWIPLATETVTDPLYTIADPNRTRLFVLEWELLRQCGTETGFVPRWGLGPRINYEEVAAGTPEP